MKVKVGDWILTTDGIVRKITSDDMPDLAYEDIARKLTEEESPQFEFKLKYEDEWLNLNKENFFDPLMKKCPLSVAAFCKWIDEYKEFNRWKQLFNYGAPHHSRLGWHDPKFHDIPWAMQFGILIDFLCDTFNGCGYGLDGLDWMEIEEVVDRIVGHFIELEVRMRNGEA